MVYGDHVDVFGGSIHIIKKNRKALVVASKEIGLQVNADKTKYMVMFRDQSAGRIHYMRMDSSSFEGWKSSNIWEQP